MAIYKLPLDDELDVDIIDWIAGFPRNKKSEVVRHALRYYMNESKEQEQVFIVNPVVAKLEVATTPPVVEKIVTPVDNPVSVEIEQDKPVEEGNGGKIVLGGQVPPKPVRKKSKKNHALLDGGSDLDDKIPDIDPLNLR